MNFGLPQLGLIALPSSTTSPMATNQLKRGRPQNGFTFDPDSAPPLPTINQQDITLQIFTHPSLRVKRMGEDLGCNTPDGDNERLSSIGRIVLDTVVTQVLFNVRPMLTASEIAMKKSEVLSDEMFDTWVNHYKLLKKLRCDLKVRSFLINKPEEIRSIFWAYVGGLYEDSQGIEKISEWIDALIAQNLDNHSSTASEMDTDSVSAATPRAMSPPPKKIKSEIEEVMPGPPLTPFGGVPTPQPGPSAIAATHLAMRNMSPVMRAPPMSAPPPNPLAPAQPNLPFLPLFNQTAAQRRVSVEYAAQFSGPSHAGKWTVRCIVNGIPKGEGTGSSKQTAKEEAARQAYYAMGWT